MLLLMSVICAKGNEVVKNTGYTNVYDKRPAENCTSSVFSLFQYKMTFDKDFLKKGYHFLTSTNFFFCQISICKL